MTGQVLRGRPGHMARTPHERSTPQKHLEYRSKFNSAPLYFFFPLDVYLLIENKKVVVSLYWWFKAQPLTPREG